MRKLVLALALAAGGSIGLQQVSQAHGGSYRGPGDTVPPGGGGPGGGSGAPGSGGGGTPSGPGPTTPGGSSPGNPMGAPVGPGASTPGGGDAGIDLTAWQFWWGFNKEPYLDLKSHVWGEGVLTGDAEWYLGRGEQKVVVDTWRPSERTIHEIVVPALLRALHEERSNDILSGAMIALAKIGDRRGEDGASSFSKEIRPFLTHASQELAETSAVALGILANDSPENVELLVALLEDRAGALQTMGVALDGEIPVRTRAFAAYGLGLVGQRASSETRARIAEALIGRLEADQERQREVPVACVTALGLVPLPLLDGARLEPERIGKRPEAVTNRSEQVQWLLAFLADEAQRELVRAHAPIALARLVSEGGALETPLRETVAEQLLERLDPHAKVSNELLESCVLALGSLGDCDADPLDASIREALERASQKVADVQAKRFALISLGQVAGRPGTGAGDPLAGLAPRKNPRSYLLGQLANGSTGVRPWAALSLAILERSLDDVRSPSSRDAKEALRVAFEGARAPDEVGACAIALGIARHVTAKESLQAKLQTTQDPEARGHIAVALGMLGDGAAIEPIQGLIERSKYQPELLKSAAIALGLLGDKHVVPVLVDMLEKANALSSQAAIASALGFIGDRRSIDPLVAMLADADGKSDRARGFAAAALGIVSDKEELPWNAKISVGINYRANTETLTSPDAGTGILDLL